MDSDMEHRSLLAGVSPAMTADGSPALLGQESPPIPSDNEQRPASWPGGDSPAIVTSPIPPIAHSLKRSSTSYPRRYTRINSLPSSTESLSRSVTEPEASFTTPQSGESSDGLGITLQAGLRRSPARRASSHVSPRIRDSLEGQVVAETSLTPSSSVLSGRTTTFDGTQDTAYHGYFGQQQPIRPTESLRSDRNGPNRAPTIYEDDAEQDGQVDFAPFRPNNHRTRPIKRNLGGWLSVVAFTLSIFCAVFSGIFLAIALNGPYWGRAVSSNQGKLSPSAAATLTSFFAKMIEMSFVTVMVAFVGQILARRSIRLEDAEGITLSEMTMRTWIMQPGTIITQWESVKYAGPTLLGIVCLFTAVLSMLYTSAATSLVQPQLRLSTWQHQDMAGVVRSQFANPEFIKQSCATPITANYDPKYAHDTCAQMEHAAMAYHNYYGYISAWTDFKAKNQSGDKLSNRPKGFALLNDNTTISAPWIEQQEVKTFNSTVPRYINNVTMAMPHIGVIQAAIDPKNALMQPIEADGSMYHIRAAVPSPFINVLCATLIEEDMKPFLINHTNKADPYATGSAVADVFGFGEKYGTMRLAPVFPRLPIDYNTLVNDTVGVPTWGRPTIFVLGKSGPQDTEGRNTSQYYSLCQLQVGTTPHCTTNYNASSTGATMDADCSDPDNRYAFSSSMQVNTTSGNATINRDWANIAGEWARSLSMNDGQFNGNSSNARLLTQFMVTQPRLNPKLPSMAEAIAVLAGCTLLQSVEGTPFDQNWNFSSPIISDPAGVRQPFNATVRVLQYASGGVWDHQKGWFCVLLLVFAANLMALCYFVSHRHWYTDVTEPTNLFLLAINSPPSRHLAEAVAMSTAEDQEGPSTSARAHHLRSWRTEAHYRVPWKIIPTDHTSGGEHSGCSGYMLESQGPQGFMPLMQQRKTAKKAKKQRSNTEMRFSSLTGSTASNRLSKRGTFAGFTWDRRKTMTSPPLGSNTDKPGGA